jgi:hypothetical protein
MRLIVFPVNPADACFQPFGSPGQPPASHHDMQGRNDSAHHFREQGGENQMVVFAQDDYFHLRGKQSFQALRQSHPGKTAPHNNNPFSRVWRDGFVFFHDQIAAASSIAHTLKTISLERGKMNGVNTP